VFMVSACQYSRGIEAKSEAVNALLQTQRYDWPEIRTASMQEPFHASNPYRSRKRESWF